MRKVTVAENLQIKKNSVQKQKQSHKYLSFQGTIVNRASPSLKKVT